MIVGMKENHVNPLIPRITIQTILYTMLIACIVCALDIVRDYEYRVETLPLPKRIKQGNTVAPEFSIVREEYYKEAAYKFRYIQSEDEGLLSYRDKAIPVNRFRDIASDNFVFIPARTPQEGCHFDGSPPRLGA
jgi:hypothetical protein